MRNVVEPILEKYLKSSPRPQIHLAVWNNGETYTSSVGTDNDPARDVFEIGSIGKTLTATLLAVLEHEGALSIDDKVSRFCPDLPFATQISLAELATHTSGLPGNPFKGIILSKSKFIEGVEEFVLEDLDKFLAQMKVPLKPGKFKYSNLGMALLGRILRDVAGTSYEQAVKEKVLQPLGMHDTHIDWQVYDEGRVAQGHDPGGRAMPHFRWEGMEPAGLWRSTTSDMLEFLKAHLGHKGEYWQEITGRTTNPVHEKVKSIGMGWLLFERKILGKTIFHNGGTFGQNSAAAVALEKDMAAIVLTNKIPRLWHFFLPGKSLDRLSIRMLEVMASSSE